MRILSVDVGTGTQDILLFNTRLDVENAFKLVLPSPTMIVHHRLKEATRRRQPVLLSGVTMGGGPSQWAAEAHAKAGIPIYATPEAARSFNDELDAIAEMGIIVISDDEASRLPGDVLRLKLRDFDLDAIRAAFAPFGESLDDLAAVAVAVFDHGAAPASVSDRQFRFDYLNKRIRSANRLSAFAYLADDIPPIMTRLKAVAESARRQALSDTAPLIVMDTAPAAVLGATFDARVSAQLARHGRALITNIGNFHTLAFRLGPNGIEGLFEHHTGLVDRSRLERLIMALADGSLRHEDVFNDHGHGALVYHHEPLPLAPGDGTLVVIGPRRGLMRGSPLEPYYAVPFGDMMIAGCFGLLAAIADLIPDLRDAILAALRPVEGMGKPPWE